MVTAVAQNMVSKRKNEVRHGPLSSDKKKSVDPTRPPQVVPNIRAKPKDQNKIEEIPKSVIFLIATFMLFFDRVRPDSRHVNPACIRKTRHAHIKTQKMFISNVSMVTCTGAYKNTGTYTLSIIWKHYWSIWFPHVVSDIFSRRCLEKNDSGTYKTETPNLKIKNNFAMGRLKVNCHLPLFLE